MEFMPLSITRQEGGHNEWIDGFCGSSLLRRLSARTQAGMGTLSKGNQPVRRRIHQRSLGFLSLSANKTGEDGESE